MSKIYDALNELRSDLSDPNSAALTDRILRGSASSLTHELVEFERLLIDRIARLRVAADEAETIAASETQQTTQTIEKLKSQIIALDSRLKETKDLLERNSLDKQALERDLTATVNQLRNDVKSKDESLASRVSEVKALQSEVNRLRDGIRGMVTLFNQQARALGGHPAEPIRVTAFVEPSMTQAQNSASSRVANPAAMFVESGAGSNEGSDASTLER